MAIPTHPEWPDAPVDRDAFYLDLQEFHRQRGTTLDAVPKVSTQPIDLYDLFHVVQENGGYDEVSGKKLEWRRLAERQYSLGGNQNAAAYAFQLKSLFYRNLAAYAIARVYKQEPPPKDILEDITAKGGNLLKRTRQSFQAEQALRHKPVQQEEDSGSERERERENRDDGLSGARTSRLRQAPPQRQFFQPDISSSRQPRQAIQQVQSPQPLMAPQTYNTVQPPVSNINSPSFQLNSWEGRNLTVGLHVRPVPTPSNNEAAFQEKLKRMRQTVLRRVLDRHGDERPLAEERPSMLPGTGYPGPNIYRRTLLALKSGIPGEVDYALHHLVKISSERGDSFCFNHHPGLADALVAQGLKLPSRFYNVEWAVAWRENYRLNGPPELDGYRGTPDLLERIAKLQKIADPGEIADNEHVRELERGNQVGLILRNMSLLPENAHFLSGFFPFGDLLTIWMCMPRYESLTELHSYVLEMVEHLAYWWSIDTIPRPLYLTVVQRLEELFVCRDRAAIFLLRALSRIGCGPTSFLPIGNSRRDVDRLRDDEDEVKSEAEESKIYGISMNLMQWILDWLLLDDDKIISTCIDFLYRYFSSPRNTAAFLQACADNVINHESYFTRLIQLIRREQKPVQQVLTYLPPIPRKIPTEILTIPADLRAEIEGIEEPKRAHLWLRCLFEEERSSDIKQISLWHAYQACWQASQVPLLQASDFIKNVSDAFDNATAQVIPGPTPRFIIKGIRCRNVPVDLEGKPYLRCRWTIRIPVSVESDPVPAGSENQDEQYSGLANGAAPTPKYKGTIERSCGSFHRDAAHLWEHILTHHLGMHRNTEGKWDLLALREEFSDQHLFCKWGKCRRFQNNIPGPDPFLMGVHIKMHMPDEGPMAEHRAKYTKVKRPEADEEPEEGHSWPEEATYITYRDTPTQLVDGRDQVELIPLHICLVFRMLVRTVPKAVAYLKANPNGGPMRETHEWLQFLMGITWDQLWNLIAYDRSLGPHLWDIVNMVQQGMEDEDGQMIDTV